jgi:hypothetical protein
MRDFAALPCLPAVAFKSDGIAVFADAANLQMPMSPASFPGRGFALRQLAV